MGKLCARSILIFLLLSLLFFHSISAVTDTINTTHGISDGETLVSSGGMFELGFFTPGNSRNRYIGIWYRNLPVRTVVWVANREAPITNTTGVILNVTEPGILILSSDTRSTSIWSSNTTRSVRNPVGQLLETGSLVVRDANDERPENFLWHSFDYPTDTYLQGMKVGWNLVTGLETFLQSWRSNDDPSPGDFSFHLVPNGLPQIVFKRGDDVVLYKNGPWNGIRFSGSPTRREDPNYRLTYLNNENEVYYWVTSFDRSLITRFSVNQSGKAQRLTWVDGRGWTIYRSMPADICDTYRLCSSNGICNIGNSPSCGCLDRFIPRNLEGWVRTDWSEGCVRRKNLSCEGDVFLRYSGIKLPDARNSWHNTSMTLEECRAECLRNCNCTAYTQLDISSRSGCLIWFADLIDIRSLSTNGQDIYIRMASSEADSGGRNRTKLVASLTSVIGAVLIGLSLFFYIKKRNNDTKRKNRRRETGLYDESHHKDSELPLFELSVILKATDNFSINKKLGEGGFGPVYKGTLEGGHEIAVKRLSKDSMQGLGEFKNEVIFIAELQHRNLVRLLGCCTQGEESMLIYEYMPNKSLDIMLFDRTNRMQLDWEKRFHIINGIARGLLYLHQDSRLRIIHRDLKASNVLLDSEMNPKISDFGMARCFGGNETKAKTNRVVGTYGYMPPEYAVDGVFSVKSDVFSFGVLVLEIVCGRRNRGFSHSDHNFNLLGHAWMLYKEGRALELVDSCLGDLFYIPEAMRSIHVGLLCVQQNPEDRPNMSSVVLMLGNEGILPEAKQPGFFTGREVIESHSSDGRNAVISKNDMTITMPQPR